MLCHDNWRIFDMHTCIYTYYLNNGLVHYKDGDIYNVYIAYMYMYQLQFYTDAYIAVYCNSAQTEPNNLVTLVPFQMILRVFHSIKLYRSRIILSFSELMSISVYELNLSKTCCMLQWKHTDPLNDLDSLWRRYSQWSWVQWTVADSCRFPAYTGAWSCDHLWPRL